MTSLPHRVIAKELNVTRQHVSALVKKGLPTQSLDAARGWYDRNVQSRYTRRKWRRLPPAEPDSFPVELGDLSVELFGDESDLAPIQLTTREHKDVVSDEEVEAWLDSKLETVEQAANLGGVLIQMLRCYIDEMPHVMAARCNPMDPERAFRQLQRWVETFDRECFTDGEETKTPAMRKR